MRWADSLLESPPPQLATRAAPPDDGAAPRAFPLLRNATFAPVAWQAIAANVFQGSSFSDPKSASTVSRGSSLNLQAPPYAQTAKLGGIRRREHQVAFRV